ncbi:hypothetical protein HJG60_010953 [Phyllostomus discolor]|uniref:Uncharacterized protein n=1 Tax=Phyllostomus discolor TaxID=89673 RepID=A0A834E6M3_9CHIR|nr:hypothetical protein HJG60_010953 [Phyllostomus discolor]
MNSPVRLGIAAGTSAPTGIFNWFEALFPCAGCTVCFAPQLFLLVYLNTNGGPPSPQSAAWPVHLVCLLQPYVPCSTICCLTESTCHLACPGPPVTASPGVLSTQLPISTPPTGLDECVFFNCLVVGLSHSSVFCQFWLFFVSKLLSFFWLCEEVCLPTPPSWLKSLLTF